MSSPSFSPRVSPGKIESWFREYAPQGQAYAKAMLRNSDDAEEMVQETFLKLMGREEPVEASQFAPLFFTALRNLCIDRLRRSHRRETRDLADVPQPGSLSQNEPHVARETLNRIDAIWHELPAEWATALSLKIERSQSYSEIAETMNASHAQVRSWIHRGRQQLRRRLAELEGGF